MCKINSAQVSVLTNTNQKISNREVVPNSVNTVLFSQPIPTKVILSKESVYSGAGIKVNSETIEPVVTADFSKVKELKDKSENLKAIVEPLSGFHDKKAVERISNLLKAINTEMLKPNCDPQKLDLYNSLLTDITDYVQSNPKSVSTTWLEGRLIKANDVINKNISVDAKDLFKFVDNSFIQEDRIRSMSNSFRFVADSGSLISQLKQKVQSLLASPSVIKNVAPEELEKINNIIKDITSQAGAEKLTENDLNYLKDFAKNVNAPGKLSDKKQVEALASNIIKIRNKEEVYSENYTNSAKQVSSSITNLQEEIGKIPPNKQNGFTRTIGILANKYQEALNSGDAAKVAVYSTLMNNITQAVKEGKSGADIENIIANYDNLTNTIFDESRPIEERTQLIKDYIGVEQYNLVKERVRQDKAETTGTTDRSVESHGSRESGEIRAFATPDHGSESASRPSVEVTGAEVLASFQKSIGTETVNGKLVPPPPTLNNTQKQELRRTTAKDIQRTLQEVPSFRKAFENFAQANIKFVAVQKEIGNFIIFTNKANENLESKFTIDKVLNELINESIKNANEMEEKLNLSVDDTGSIVPLLEKFRDIISKLDMDSKENIKKTLEASGISNSFSSSRRDMNLRWESLDKVKKELNKLFEEIKIEQQTVK